MRTRIKYTSIVCGFFVALGATALLSVPSNAIAGFYKCVDDNGSTTYSQTPCPIDEMTAKVINSGGAPTDPGDCKIAQRFMAKTAKQMLAGASSATVYDSYGGIDSIPRTSVALINYVYTFQHNKEVSAERITGLSMARCRSGSFGSTTCDDFPFSYIESQGGCELAASGAAPAQYPTSGAGADGQGLPQNLNLEALQGLDLNNLQNMDLQALQQRLAQMQNGGADTAGGVDLQAAQALPNKQALCQNKLKSKIENVELSMRNGASAAQQDSLRQQRRNLQKRLSKC